MQELQQILGTDKRNPSFTICRNSKDANLHVYYGGELFEKVPDDRNDHQFKLMVARLYNAGVNAVKLKEVFEVDPKTMQRWGGALKSGDPEKLVHVLAGRQVNRKLTLEIRVYARMHFPAVYRDNPFSYSKQIRAEILDVYNEALSSETLRILIKELKSQLNAASLKRETSCESSLSSEADDNEEISISQPRTSESCINECLISRKMSPLLEMPTIDGHLRFVHHLGVLIFSSILEKVESLLKEDRWVAKQWLASIFLGAVNIEQSKLLDFDGLSSMLGKTLRSLRPQRLQLGALARSEGADPLLILNAKEVKIHRYSDFYYDPHTKHCKTKVHILKGWCGSKHFADKALHMDFIHTCAGHPVYIGYRDNYDDLRERFTQVVDSLEHW